MNVFGTIEEVFKHFQNAENFEVDPQSATVTVPVFQIKNYRPVQKLVPLSLKKEKIMVEADKLLEEIDVLKGRISNLEHRQQ